MLGFLFIVYSHFDQQLKQTAFVRLGKTFIRPRIKIETEKRMCAIPLDKFIIYPLKRQGKMHLKMSSAEVVCCK